MNTINNDICHMFKKVAHGAGMTILNFLEFTIVSCPSQEICVSDSEMKKIIKDKDKDLLRDLKRGEKEIEEGRFKIVG